MPTPAPFDYSHPKYLAAKRQAFERTEGWCAYCGRERAEHAHHWRGYEPGSYLSEERTTANELIPLCVACHDYASKIRKAKPFDRKPRGGKPSKLLDILVDDGDGNNEPLPPPRTLDEKIPPQKESAPVEWPRWMGSPYTDGDPADDCPVDDVAPDEDEYDVDERPPSRRL